MITKTKQDKAKQSSDDSVRWYKIPYPASAYTFPRDALVERVRFDERHIHLELADGRILSIPLSWIPSLYNAVPVEREKYEISHDRTMIIWDPDKCAINDELRISDYLQPTSKPSNVIAESKTEYRTKPRTRKRTTVTRKSPSRR